MTAVVAGDRRARLDLVKLLWPRFRRTARHLSPFPDEVDDLAQEAMLQVLRSAPRFSAEGCLEAWADVVAVRTMLRTLRGHHRRNRVLVHAEIPAAASGDDAEASLVRRARADHLDALLYRLPADQRVALVLKLVEGHTVDEVADRMGKRPQTVRYLLRKGRKRLRAMAERDPHTRELLPWRAS